MSDKGNSDNSDMAVILGFGLIAVLITIAVQTLRDDAQRVGMAVGWAKAQVLAPVVGFYQDMAGCRDQDTQAFLEGEGKVLLARSQNQGLSQVARNQALEEVRRRLLLGLGRGPLSRCYRISEGDPKNLFHAIALSYGPSEVATMLDDAYKPGFSRQELQVHPRFGQVPRLIDEILALSANSEDDEVQGSRALYSKLRRRLSNDPYNLEEAYIDRVITELQGIRPTRIENASAVAATVASSTGRLVSIVLYMPLLLAGAGYIFFIHKGSKFRRKLNLEAFAGYQAKVWHAILPAIAKNPMTDKSGVWRESMTPEEWLDEHRILVVDGLPDREGVREAFIRQLKFPFRGVTRMAPHRQALVAVFALQAARKIKDGREILALCSKGWTAHGSVAMAMKKDPVLAKLIQSVLKNSDLMSRINEASRLHAYEETVLASMLEFCRVRGGVLASAEFLWLKPEDRGLWYIMNDTGRPTFHVESAGVIAHYKAEKATRRPLPEPDVDEAVFGLEEHMQKKAPVS